MMELRFVVNVSIALRTATMSVTLRNLGTVTYAVDDARAVSRMGIS